MPEYYETNRSEVAAYLIYLFGPEILAEVEGPKGSRWFRFHDPAETKMEAIRCLAGDAQVEVIAYHDAYTQLMKRINK
jgi:hypothetical protein